MFFITRDGNYVVINVDFFPESKVSLAADELDKIRNFAVSKISIGLKKLWKTEINKDKYDIIPNALIHTLKNNFESIL